MLVAAGRSTSTEGTELVVKWFTKSGSEAEVKPSFTICSVSCMTTFVWGWPLMEAYEMPET